jgi:hypothetical protein
MRQQRQTITVMPRRVTGRWLVSLSDAELRDALRLAEYEADADRSRSRRRRWLRVEVELIRRRMCGGKG